MGGAGETYTYDAASNRLLSVLAGGVTRSFTWSNSGNVAVDDAGGAAFTLTYNSLDRLVEVSAGGISLVDYTYAATGQRAVKTTPTATTHYLYDPGGALQAETDGAGTTLREYITLGGATIAIVDAGGMNFVHDDHLGTPEVMTDVSATVVWDASYRPFGEASIAGAAANDQRFPGQTADAETGYYDNWYRTYDPRLGRYLQSDPIGLAAGFNSYAYAGGNPVMYADPTGQCPWCEAALVGALFSGGFEAGLQIYQHGHIVSWSRVGYAAGAGALSGVLGFYTKGLGWLGFGYALGGEALIGAGYACITGANPRLGALYGALGFGVGRAFGGLLGRAAAAVGRALAGAGAAVGRGFAGARGAVGRAIGDFLAGESGSVRLPGGGGDGFSGGSGFGPGGKYPFGNLNGMPISEAKGHVANWDKGTYSDAFDSIRDHAFRKGYGGDIGRYLRKADEFFRNTRRASRSFNAETGTTTFRKNQEYIQIRNGKIVSYGSND